MPAAAPWGSLPQQAPARPQPPAKRRQVALWATVMVVLLAAFALVSWQLAAPAEVGLRNGFHPRPPITKDESRHIPTYSTAVTAQMSVGVVFIEGQLDDGVASGTGIVLDESGLVLTNYHVVADTTGVQAQVADTGTNFTADVLGRNVWADVALIQLEGAAGLATATIAGEPVVPGDPVVAVGNGDGGGVLLATGGGVTALDATVSLESAFGGYGWEDATGMIESSAGAIPGYSGGPTFNDRTEVVGVTSAGQDPVSDEMTTYSIPIDTATGITDDIAAGRQSEQTRVGPGAWLGIELGSHNIPVVSTVEPGSPAKIVGITPGSTIDTFAGEPVNTASGLLKVLESHDPDETVEVTWTDEQGDAHEAMMTLGTSPTN